MMTAWLHGPMFRLNIVVMSSLAFLAYGFNPPSGVIEVLQLPVAGVQVYFILAVLMQNGLRGFIAPLTNLQRGLIAALIGYMFIVSAVSPVPSAHVLVSSWVIHVLFFVAMLGFFEKVDLEHVDTVWLALGVAALIHVSAFLIAWLGWPEEIKPKTLFAFGHIRHLSYLLAPASAVMAVRFIARREGALLSALCFAAAALYIFFTGSRGGAIALLGGLVFASIYLFWNRQGANIARVAILALITAALLVVTELLPHLPFPWVTILDRGENALNQTGFELLTGRDQVWSFVATAISQNWPWGYGPVIMSQLPGWQGTAFYHPHNIVLQFLLHWGVVGTTLLLAIVAGFRGNIKTALCRQPARAALPATALTTMVIHALIDGNFFYPFSIVLAITALVVLISVGLNSTEHSNTDNKTG